VIKVFVDDSLGERIWVDRCDCKAFVNNIVTAFNTRLPKISMFLQDSIFKTENTGGREFTLFYLISDDTLH